MKNSANGRAIEREGIHIGDCYVWSEIYYLDSSNDYREFLPRAGKDNPRDDDFVCLDSLPPSKGAISVFIFAVLVCIALAGYLVDTVVHVF
jgi:hypothetical protein